MRRRLKERHQVYNGSDNDIFYFLNYHSRINYQLMIFFIGLRLDNFSQISFSRIKILTFHYLTTKDLSSGSSFTL